MCRMSLFDSVEGELMCEQLAFLCTSANDLGTSCDMDHHCPVTFGQEL